MSIYSDAAQLKELLLPIINEAIEKHDSVKSAIKAKKARVVAVNTTTQEVTVNLFGDTTQLTFPYNPQIPIADLAVGKVISVWYNQSVNNGIVMQNSNWTA